MLGIDTWVDTASIGKHPFVEAFIIGKFITEKVITAALGFIDNLPIAKIVYAYHTENGETIILEAKN